MTALPTIVRIPILPFGMVNAHLILTPQACVLVDTGLPGSEAKIARALGKVGRTVKDISLIVVTHAHVDHAGSAASLRELSGAPILGHAADCSFYRQEQPMHFCSTGWFGTLFLKTRLICQPYRAFQPDIVLADGEAMPLERFGVDGSVHHCPGHTDGSLALTLGSSDAMVGDLLASGVLLGGLVRTGRARRPPFEDHPHLVAAALEAMVDNGMQRFYMGHGGPLPAAEVRRHACRLRALPPTAHGALTRAPAG